MSIPLALQRFSNAASRSHLTFGDEMKQPIASRFRRDAPTAPVSAPPTYPAPDATPADTDSPSVVGGGGGGLIKPAAELERHYDVSNSVSFELDRRDQARAARVATALEYIDGLNEQCRLLAIDMNAALMQRPDDPSKAINIDKARELQAKIDKLKSDIRLHEAVIEAARQDEARWRRQEAALDAQQRIANRKKAAEGRLAAARKVDSAVRGLAAALREADVATDVFMQSLYEPGKRVDRFPFAGFSRLLDIARCYLAHLGQRWAAPDQPYRPHVPSVAEWISQVNAELLGRSTETRSAAE